MNELFTLPAGWFKYVVEMGVDEKKPGIYRWTIDGDGGGSYIGKYKRINRPMKEYGRNVQRLRNRQDYRKGNPDGYRLIHRALESAVREKRHIELCILENVDPATINARERELIQLYGTLNGPITILSKHRYAGQATALQGNN